MLVLSRKIDEAIIINDNIKVIVIQINGDRVKLGIEADNSIPVHREEIHEAIQKEKGKI
jgi:carbon storage regulator